ncbi:MAG: DEAD/DEAH box helicase [Cycloclasticus sp.]
MSQQYSPGMRVEIRDAEWRIERLDRTPDGGYLLRCMGLSELVRGKTAQFLSGIELSIKILDPAKTQLNDDLSDGYLASQLYIDTALRQTPPVDNRIHMGAEAAMDILPFQLDPALQALKQPRQRILIADSVGLGKTLEAGILTTELIRRGRGKRILVLAVKSMLTQFQKEFWQRFTIPLVRLDSVGLQRVRNDIPTNHNPFHYYDRTIISIDTLKQTLEYRHHLEQAYWDIIIIDEAHNVAKRSTQSQRHKLAELLSTRSDTLIMLSATPHDGKAESFASLVNMLDPTAISNPKDYGHEDFKDKGLVIRGFKHDVANQLAKSFPEREIKTKHIAASAAEEAAYDQLSNVTFSTLDSKRQTGAQLFRTTLEKSLFSSPEACLSTVTKRLKLLAKKEQNVDIQNDISTLEGLKLSLEGITPASFSKYQLLVQLLKPTGDNSLGWSGKETTDRLVIFTESLITLNFLHEQLTKDLKLKKNQIAILKGEGMRDHELADTVEKFGQASSPIRLLLCSDVASEGINLHHLSHRMVHFDIPWSLMVFQQRNGRIDRYGQTIQPQIRYLMTNSENPKIKGDQRILEVLIEKDEQAGINIGDPAEFMGEYSETGEEDKVAQAMEQEKDPNDLSDIFGALFTSEDDNIADTAKTTLAAFIPENERTNHQQLSDVIAKSETVFADNLAYAEAALNCINEQQPDRPLSFKVDKASRQIDFTAPSDLAQRLKYLPKEVRPEANRFIFTDDKTQIQDGINAARMDDDELLADLHFLWQQHPVMEWMMTRVQDYFGRHTAPVIRLNSLEDDEHWYIVQGGFPNKRGQALIQSSMAVLVQDGKVMAEAQLSELLKQFNLKGEKIPNRAINGGTKLQQQHLPIAIKQARSTLQANRDTIEASNKQRLDTFMQELKALRKKHEGQLELDLFSSAQTEGVKNKKKQDRMHHIDRVFNEYELWLKETQTTEEDPYLQVVAVLTGQAAVAKENI